MKFTRLAALGAAFALSFATYPAAAPTAQAQEASPEEMYTALRNLALSMQAEDIGIEVASPDEAYGVIMDMGFGADTVTLTSFASGDASIYFSTGGGFLGSGQASEDVANAARAFVAKAGRSRELLTPVESLLLPGADSATFYVISSSGIRGASADLDALHRGEGELVPLFAAAQNVITEIRLLRERQEAAQN